MCRSPSMLSFDVPFLDPDPIKLPFMENSGPFFLPIVSGCAVVKGSVDNEMRHDFSLDAIDYMVTFLMTFHGSAKVSFPHEDQSLFPGSILILKQPSPVRIHLKNTGSPWGFFYINFRDSRPLESLLWLQSRIGQISRPVSMRDPEVRKFVRDSSQLIGDMAKAQQGSEIEWSGRTYDWFLSCLRMLQISPSIAQLKDKSETLPRPAILSEKCGTIKEYARQMHCSPGYLSRKLLASWHKPAGKALREARLERSIELLGSTDQSINEIANQLGYASTSSFIRAFKLHFGCTPARMRRSGL
ncbi:AraC family transcriptional regulator [Rubellicoccus peritrichatus]|uniref:AraC family transcriptional regulator n=1 Tax=Rubellicoccus peritrichatus TaxID=3080537 RepID=A0AAQ3L5H4_9BACT|nr:AraC family transcriptional regulator [Puniceicoccus sp. CR14]WOO39371.1 AraC family transcriptional regulator [Puniceicoccus sp. CR14]